MVVVVGMAAVSSVGRSMSTGGSAMVVVEAALAAGLALFASLDAREFAVLDRVRLAMLHWLCSPKSVQFPGGRVVQSSVEATSSVLNDMSREKIGQLVWGIFPRR
jgi:hypothetical protein